MADPIGGSAAAVGGALLAVSAADDAEVAEEARLMEHNQRFQAAVLAAMDKQLSNMEAQLAARDHTIETTQKARTDLAVSLGATRKQMTDLRTALNKRCELLRMNADRPRKHRAN